MHSLSLLKQKSVYLLFIMFACLAGCKEQISPAPEAVRVSYLVAKSHNVPLMTEMPGRVSAFLVSDVRPQVSGIIQKRLFEEGTDVKEGQQLYQIDPSLFQAAYNSAKAELERAQANAISARLLAERYGKVVDIQAVSKQDYDNAIASRDQANAAVSAAKQALETARINLEYTKVLAPVSGRISRSYVTPGALVTQNQSDPLAKVQQLSPVYVDVTQSSNDLLKLRKAFAAGEIQSTVNKGAKIKLKLEDGSLYIRVSKDIEGASQPVYGELQFSDVTIEQTTGVVTLRATFDNPDNILLPGMYVRAVIEEGVREGAILLPQKVVQHDMKNRPTVFVLTKTNPNEGQPNSDLGPDEFYVALRYITVDRDYENQWLVTDGLHMGDRVVVDGLQKIQNGQVVVAERLDQKSMDTLFPSVKETSQVVIEENKERVVEEGNQTASQKENESVPDTKTDDQNKKSIEKNQTKIESSDQTDRVSGKNVQKNLKKTSQNDAQKIEKEVTVPQESQVATADTLKKEKREVKKTSKPKTKTKMIETPVTPRQIVSEPSSAKEE